MNNMKTNEQQVRSILRMINADAEALLNEHSDLNFSNGLKGLFIWEDTKQGHNYWECLHNKVMSMIENNTGKTMNQKQMMEALLAGETLVHETMGCMLMLRADGVIVNEDNHERVLPMEMLYTIKPRTRKLGGIEYPEPLRVAPLNGAKYYYLSIGRHADYYDATWENDVTDWYVLNNGLCQATREGAILQRKAILAAIAKGD